MPRTLRWDVQVVQHVVLRKVVDEHALGHHHLLEGLGTGNVAHSASSARSTREPGTARTPEEASARDTVLCLRATGPGGRSRVLCGEEVEDAPGQVQLLATLQVSADGGRLREAEAGLQVAVRGRGGEERGRLLGPELYCGGGHEDIRVASVE